MAEERKPRIEICAPSRALVDPHDTNQVDEKRIRRIRWYLRNLGWERTESSNVRKNFQRFAGDDANRAAALQRALCKKKNDLVLALRGGYGAIRILPLLNWNRLKKKICVPLAGFSDITVLHMALYAKLGRESWQTPCASSFSKTAKLRDWYFMHAFESEHFDLDFRGYAVDENVASEFKVNGHLWGGNLSSIVSLIGTEYFPKFRKSILYLEDVNESPYQIERMLLQLLESKVLANQEALLLGDFTGADKGEGEGAGRFTLQDVLSYIQKRVGIPIVTGLPFGHILQSASLPFGSNAKVQFNGRHCSVVANVSKILPRHVPKV